MVKLFRNTEMKRITLEIVILYLIFSLCTYFFTEYRLKVFSESLIRQNMAVVGTVLCKNPELEKDIIKCYTKEIPKETLDMGEKALKSYGYGTFTFLNKVPIIKDFHHSFLINTLLIGGIFFIFIIGVTIFEYSSMFKKVRSISYAAEKVVEGDFNVKLSEKDEGEFNILAHQFNQMSDRLENSIDRLKKEKRFLKDIISDISHQLKTPLSSLMVFNELFIDGSIKDEQSKINFHNKSRSQLERMEWLIKNLLKIAKIEAEAVEFEKNYNSLRVTIDKALEPLKLKWKSKKQIIEIEMERDINFKHDTNWTAEAITNIVKNCIEHTGERGKIAIQAFETPLSVSVVITDNGEGIPKEDLPHIFERFYKGKQNRNSDSVGIGLALCKSIIENQGGSVEARSAYNKGTEFNINFLTIL